MYRVRTGPGNPGKPWKIYEALKIPGKTLEFFLLSPGKSQNFIEKICSEVVHFVDFITSNNRGKSL